MIPSYDVNLDATIPNGTSYWTASAEELDEHGTPGDFHDTELIRTDIAEARSVVEAELVAIQYLDAQCSSAAEFDELASDIEFEIPDMPSEEAPDFITQTASWYGVNQLEIGVAGLVYALNAVGIVTSASCRSHHQGHQPWSNYPVVVFSANREQLRLLAPLVAAARCGFERDEVDRSHLMAIVSTSVVDMNVLASSILNVADAFELLPPTSS